MPKNKNTANPDLPAHRVCLKLNELLTADPDAFHALIENRVPVNDKLVDKPDIVVLQTQAGLRMGCLSLMNVLMSETTNDRIVAVYNDEPPNKLIGFRPWSTVFPPESDSEAPNPNNT